MPDNFLSVVVGWGCLLVDVALLVFAAYRLRQTERNYQLSRDRLNAALIERERLLQETYPSLVGTTVETLSLELRVRSLGPVTLVEALYQNDDGTVEPVGIAGREPTYIALNDVGGTYIAIRPNK